MRPKHGRPDWTRERASNWHWVRSQGDALLPCQCRSTRVGSRRRRDVTGCSAWGSDVQRHLSNETHSVENAAHLHCRAQSFNAPQVFLLLCCRDGVRVRLCATAAANGPIVQPPSDTWSSGATILTLVYKVVLRQLSYCQFVHCARPTPTHFLTSTSQSALRATNCAWHAPSRTK